MRTLALTCTLLSMALPGCSGDDAGDGGTAAATSTGSTGGGETMTPTTMEPTTDEPTTMEPTTMAMESSTSSDPDDTGADSTDAGDTMESSGSTDGTTGAVEFTLTSPAFKDGGGIPGMHHVQGGNVHPQLDWVGAPAETMSFGVFFHDVTIDFEHSAIWNIPADATGLPEGVERAPMPDNVPGAVQCQAWNGGFGYGGPGSASNLYQFTLYALDTDDLSGEINQNTDREDVRAALEAHMIATATLQGQSTGP